MKKLDRRSLLTATAAGAAALMAPGAMAQGAPIRIGSTLALTGPLSATGLTHKLVGDIYVEQLNARGVILAQLGTGQLHLMRAFCVFRLFVGFGKAAVAKQFGAGFDRHHKLRTTFVVCGLRKGAGLLPRCSGQLVCRNVGGEGFVG